ncbi:hypothetical protein KAX97_14910 [candidate division WOR-3 bacterium]|nr:hypothetical protein [candidate division WOR-3 bacterium]
MRTRILALGLACLLLFSILSAQLAPKDLAKLSPEEAAMLIEKKLRRSYDFRVTTEMKDEKVNFLFNLKTPILDSDLEDCIIEIVMWVGEVTNYTSWRSDKAIVSFKNKPFFWIYTKDCREAISEAHFLDKMKFITAHLHYFKK